MGFEVLTAVTIKSIIFRIRKEIEGNAIPTATNDSKIQNIISIIRF
jgi:hypothetical protein